MRRFLFLTKWSLINKMFQLFFVFQEDQRKIIRTSEKSQVLLFEGNHIQDLCLDPIIPLTHYRQLKVKDQELISHHNKIWILGRASKKGSEPPAAGSARLRTSHVLLWVPRWRSWDRKLIWVFMADFSVPTRFCRMSYPARFGTAVHSQAAGWTVWRTCCCHIPGCIPPVSRPDSSAQTSWR